MRNIFYLFVLKRHITMSVSTESVLVNDCGMPFSSLTTSSKNRSLKRKRSSNEIIKDVQKSYFKKLLKDFQEISTGNNAERNLEIVPKPIKIFFTTFVKQVQSMNNTFYVMNQLFENNKILITNQQIRNRFQTLTENTRSEFRKLTNDLINDLDKSLEKHMLSLDLTHPNPIAKLRKINKAESKSEVNVPENKPFNEFSDSEIDFSGSDIDLQLEEAVDAVCGTNAIAKNNPENLKLNKNVLPPKTLTSSTVLQKDYIHDLNYDSDGFLLVYTDGACLNNGYPNAQAGFGVWFGDNTSLNISEPVHGTPTNNNAEIQAVTHAVLQANRIGVKKIRIFTDSKFLINCMTQWISKWKQNNWRTSAKEPVKNKESLIELDKVLPLMDAIDWKYVEAHKGIPGNEKADILAKEGAKKYVIKK